MEVRVSIDRRGSMLWSREREMESWVVGRSLKVLLREVMRRG